MGTPEFAVASLKALVNAGCNIVAVVTAPDKPAGRGLQLTESAVKKYAVANNLPVLQPEKLKSPDFIETLKKINADIQIVVAFRMLPEIVWNMPPMGTINVHGSLLPHYRGAAPINWAIINGEKETGVTTFKLKHEIDAGNILLQTTIAIQENETAGEIHDTMKEAGAELLLKTLQELAEGKIKEQKQDDLIDNSLIKHAPKIFTETCKIDFAKSTEQVHNLIRGLSPFPGAFTYIDNKIVKIFISRKEIIHHTNSIGTIISDGKTFLKFTCLDGYIHVLELQLEGKKRMKIEDFLRGNKINVGVKYNA
ncbi:MAG: methionyl-tRNA formyltransferase [Chitinophagaceae bacterium]|nr:methionyl-tRNA formyltransferase [Chitinophagaceae bacterium]MCW5904976.1 methionyl-tRNA formyltransferase [Chitinophagaceae bacterium]